MTGRFFLFLILGVLTCMAEESPTPAAGRLTANAPEWSEISELFAQQPETRAQFEERRFFAFRKEPVVLRGEVRVSRARGLSLHYAEPEPRTIVIDDEGMVLRDAGGKDSPPPDPRAQPVNEALRHVLRFDLAALDGDFEVFGRREGAQWWLGLTPRTTAGRRAIGEILVAGEGAAVLRIELRRSAKQRIEILMSNVSPASFSPDELKRYFR